MATRTQFQLQPSSDCVHEQMCEAVYEQQRKRLQVLCEWMTGGAGPARQLAVRVFVEAWRQAGGRWPAVGGDHLAECFALAFRGAFHDDQALATEAVGPRLVRKAAAAEGSDPLRDPLRRAVAALPTGQRLLYLLHDLEGYPPSTLAAWLDLDPRQCAGMIHQARVQLRQSCSPA